MKRRGGNIVIIIQGKIPKTFSSLKWVRGKHHNEHIVVLLTLELNYTRKIYAMFSGEI